MANPAPGFAERPAHRVEIRPCTTRVRVTVGEQLVAESLRPLRLAESTLPVVWYLPLSDVNEELLQRSDTSTYCPFKGHASYWSLTTADGLLDDAVWAYEDPYDECAQLAGHVAFYANKVSIAADA